MGDISNPKLLYLKAGLFVVTGLIACGLILAESPSLLVAALLAVAIWCFARAYYFTFYVIEHYIDPGYRYAGVWSFVRYALTRSRSNRATDRPGQQTGQTPDSS